MHDYMHKVSSYTSTPSSQEPVGALPFDAMGFARVVDRSSRCLCSVWCELGQVNLGGYVFGGDHSACPPTCVHIVANLLLSCAPYDVSTVFEGFKSTIIDHQSAQFYLGTLPHAGDEFRGDLVSQLSFDLTMSTGVTTLRGT